MFAVYNVFFFKVSGAHRELHVLTHSFPPLRASDLWSPASRMIMLYPKFFHTAKITIAGIAQAGSPSQSIGAIPTRPSPQSISPYWAWNRYRQISATATSVVTTGAK